MLLINLLNKCLVFFQIFGAVSNYGSHPSNDRYVKKRHFLLVQPIVGQLVSCRENSNFLRPYKVFLF